MSNIKCPSCATVFDVENVLSADVEQKIRLQYEKQLQQSRAAMAAERAKLEAEQKSFEEKRKNENEIFQQKLQQEKQKLEAEIQQQVRRSLEGDYANQIKVLEQNCSESEKKLKSAREKELQFLQKEQALKNREAELELQVQKQLMQERVTLSQQIRKEEADKTLLKETEYQLKLRELEKQLEDQRRLAEEMKRRAE